jgi:DNA polymerase-3 subunit delta'
MAGGSYTRAVDMSRSNWIQRRKWLITAGGLEKPETMVKRPKSSLLAFSEQLAKNRSTVEDSLGVMKTWLRDLVVWKYTPDKIINKDLAEIIADTSEKNSVNDLLKKFDTVEQTERDIKTNMNVRLCLDILMLRLAAKY